MPRRTLAVALAALLAISAVLVFAPTPGHGAAASVPASAQVSGAAHPSAAIAYTILNGYGGYSTNFYPGEVGWGTLCFTVTDFVDHAVNITVSDPNAARDGVATPAFHYEAVLNTTTFTFNSYQAHVGYSFPASLPYGGTWTVNLSAPNAGSVQQDISVFVYYTSLSTSIGYGATLPGQPVTVFWYLLSEANGASLYTHATNVTISGTYIGNGTSRNLFATGRVALTPASAGHGQWSGTVPANATPDTQLRFVVSAVTNVSGVVLENETSSITVDVGLITIHAVGLTVAPPTCALVNSGYYVTGSLLAGCLEAGADYYGTFTPIAGLPVTVGYWDGTAHVLPGGGAPTSLVTNASGEAAFTFLASSPPFLQTTQYPGVNALNFTVSVPGASAHYQWTSWWNLTWQLYGHTPSSGVVQVGLDHTTYYAGATATATWAVSSTNSTQTGPVTPVGWFVTGPDGVTYRDGVLNATLSSGTFTFAITPAMVPNTIYVDVFAANTTDTFDGYASAQVLTTSLLLTPASGYYTAGATASVMAVLNGGGAGATIEYQATGYYGNVAGVLSNGTVANGSSISISVPTTNPPQAITVDAWATEGGQVIATSSVNVLLALGYSILLGVTTPSSYTDGSYQPGQTVTLSYQVVATGGAALPQVMSFDLLTIGYPFFTLLQNVGPSGTVSFTIPSNAVEGTLLLELVATGAFTVGTCLPGGLCAGVLSLAINPNPSVFSLELGAGSGLTVGWLVLLILVIAVTVVLVLLIRRRGGPRTSIPSSTTSTMGPPAEAPTTPPPTEWQAPPPPPPPEPAPEPAPSAPSAPSSEAPPLPRPPSKGH